MDKQHPLQGAFDSFKKDSKVEGADIMKLSQQFCQHVISHADKDV
jgi:hypothetical protein